MYSLSIEKRKTKSERMRNMGNIKNVLVMGGGLMGKNIAFVVSSVKSRDKITTFSVVLRAHAPCRKALDAAYDRARCDESPGVPPLLLRSHCIPAASFRSATVPRRSRSSSDRRLLQTSRNPASSDPAHHRPRSASV